MELAEAFDKVLDALVEIVQNPEATEEARLNAASLIVNYEPIQLGEGTVMWAPNLPINMTDGLLEEFKEFLNFRKIDI